MKKTLAIIIFLLLSNQAYADKKFEKDSKKLSKHNGFVDNLNKIYPIDNISNKKNTIVYAHDKDNYETSKTLSFLDLKTVNYKDISTTDCKGKLIYGKSHGIPLRKCFAEKQSNVSDLINFLEQIT